MTPKFDETLSGQDGLVTYSRANRQKQKRVKLTVKDQHELDKEDDPLVLQALGAEQDSWETDLTVADDMVVSTRVKFSHHLLILFFSLLVSGLSVAVPNFTEFANRLQSQNLYTGLMLSKGQLPYSDIFATGGFLYYGLIALAYHFKTTLWLVLAQFVANYLSGIFLNKLVSHLTGYREAAGAMTAIFYLLNITLGFGGLYPIQLAMPFVLLGLWLLALYFSRPIRDEWFILYGFTASVAILFEPRTLVFWSLSSLFLVGYNLFKGYLAKGFYQVLCILVGASSVLYAAGYFIFNWQLLLPYLKQTLLFSFTHFAAGDEPLLISAGVQLLLALFSGLLVGWFVFTYHIWKTKRDRLLKWLLFLTLTAYLVMLVLSESYEPYHQLIVLPYGLLLSTLLLKPKSDEILTHRKSPAYSATKFFNQFLMKHAFLPLLVMAYAVVMPVWSYVNSESLHQERLGLAVYLADKTKASEPIYVWDDNALIYLASARQTASQFATPVVYTSKASHKDVLMDELLQEKAKYIVVNVNQPLTSELEGLLKTKYKWVELTNLSQFKVYKKK